ncbi:LLM class flavin-dependent oxidoreductase [Promicromonospora sp. NPDC090134]|uniref:LLM class flavin-dependent oxidoreductase n=1 Tax=Promicromonospora sp. NPDC090134 TaxID=3364408 RepID=UPI0038134BF7
MRGPGTPGEGPADPRAPLSAATGATSHIGPISNIMLSTVWSATLFANEVTGIDGVSGGRLTLGIGAGIRPDDLVVEGLGAMSRGGVPGYAARVAPA